MSNATLPEELRPIVHQEVATPGLLLPAAILDGAQIWAVVGKAE